MDPAKHLGAISVMFRREAGYDDDNQDWFWVKYLPDGSLYNNAMGGSLAGRIAKGMDAGCIACHSAEDDYVFTSDAIKRKSRPLGLPFYCANAVVFILARGS